MNQNEYVELKQKYTFKIFDKKLILTKNAYESRFHVFAKAYAYAVFFKNYPDMIVEPKRVGRYRPDIICYDSSREPCFWAECGKIQSDKIKWITGHYRNLHFVITKRAKEIFRFKKEAQKLIHKKFNGKFEIMEFPEKTLEINDKKIELNPDEYDLKIIEINN